MLELLQSFAFGLTVIFLIIGIIGTIVPLIPGIFIIWLAVLAHGLLTGFSFISTGSFLWISLIALVTGTSDIWMSYLGAKKGGASKEALLYGTGGAILGTFLLPLLGTIVGYAAGLLYGEYKKHGDWETAKKAGMGGIAGWGIATAVQFVGGILMNIIFFANYFTTG
ncbi:MAG: DUF456 domain-containing protein [Anaerolineales bacterium]|nr:DUF456 domain-containing protein [Anaerolineales bacterium]MCA9928166.1 DUF456 domain-containing protein [Anaerolineales bacterium]